MIKKLNQTLMYSKPFDYLRSIRNISCRDKFLYWVGILKYNPQENGYSMDANEIIE